MTQDVLGNQPARPSTVVPGYWLLDLPPLSTIHVRRYRCRPSTFPPHGTLASGSMDAAAALQRLREDSLELAWRAVNSNGVGGHVGPCEHIGHGGHIGQEGQGGHIGQRGIIGQGAHIGHDDVRGVLAAGCAVVSYEPDDDGERVLWCFASSAQEGSEGSDLPFPPDSGDGAEGLEEILPREPAIHVVHLVKCSKHGHALSCLASPRPDGPAGPVAQPCDVRWTESEALMSRWKRLGHAVVERLAWRRGQRVWMDDSGKGFTRAPATVTLLPMASPSLLLHVEPRPIPRCRSISDKRLPLHQSPLLLLPLGVPALCLGPQPLSESQIVRQTARFHASLGPGWKTGRAERCMAAQLAEEPWSDWSVYWVPTGPRSDADLAQYTAAQLAQKWQEGKGVVTLWPTHLAYDLSTNATPSTAHKRDPVPVLGVPTHEELMGAAAEVFEQMTAYREPAVKERTPSAEEPIIHNGETDIPAHRSFFDRPAQSPLAPRANGTGNGDSDLEDLFSTHSGSPETTKTIQMDSDRASPDDLLGGPESNHQHPAPDAVVHAVQTVVDDELPAPHFSTNDFDALFDDDDTAEDAKVTEDDFDFFDSPAAEKPALESIAEEVAITDPKIPTSPALTPIQPVPPNETAIPSISPVNSMRSLPSDRPPTPPHPAVNDPQPDLLPFSTEEGPSSRSTASDRLRKRKRASTVADMIPSDFEALPLPSASNARTSQIYAPPSPTPTPESIRPDLITRLRPPAKAGAYDYAREWIMEPEQSETEEEEWSGAPPTPESELDDTESTSGRPTPVVPVESRRGDEVQYGSIVCVGPELAILTNDDAGRVTSETAWPLATTMLDSSMAPIAFEPMLDIDKLDLELFCLEIVQNSRFRASLLSRQVKDPSMDLQLLGDLMNHGEALKDIAGLLDDPAVNDDQVAAGPLETCKVHAGYNGNVMRLDISGIRYWQEIGLQPVGGKKDMQALVICETASSQAYGKAFLGEMQDIYKKLRLGSLSLVERPEVSTSASVTDLYDILAKAIDAADENTVIFVLRESPLGLSFNHKSPRKTVVVHHLALSDPDPRRMESIAFDIYNRMPRLPRKKDLHGVEDTNISYMQYPSLTLAPDHPPRPSLMMTWPIRSYDVFNRWRLVHAAYVVVLDCLVALVMDADGENFQMTHWKVAGNGWKSRLDALWGFMARFASTAAVEWRLSVSALGGLEQEEHEAWTSLIASKKAPVTLLVVEAPCAQAHASARMRPQAANVPTALLTDPSATLVDETLVGHTISYHHRVPLLARSHVPPLPGSGSASGVPGVPGVPSRPSPTYPRSTFVLSMATLGSDHVTAVYHVLQHRPAPGKEEEQPDKLFAREFYRLACLARVRFGMTDDCLPVHLESVRLIKAALEMATAPSRPG